MVCEIKTKQGLLDYLDDFILEIECHDGYRNIVHIMDNPGVVLLSKITGYQPGYFGSPMNNGEYVKFDVEKVKKIRDEIEKTEFPESLT